MKARRQEKNDYANLARVTLKFFIFLYVVVASRKFSYNTVDKDKLCEGFVRITFFFF